MSATRYENPETKAQLDEARQQLEQKEQVETADEATAAAAARADLAAEDQPGRDLPDLRETVTEEFRGEPFEFGELGGSMLDAMRELNADPDADVEDAEVGAERGEFVYSLLGEKCIQHAPSGEPAPESYWRQYDLQRPDETDGVIDLFMRLVDASIDTDETDPEVQERVEEFRG